MYSTFFNLTSKPFQLTPDPEFLYLSRGHRRALTYLTYGVDEHVGFIMVTGEVGMGKTTLIRGLMKNLRDDMKVARVNNTKVSAEQLIAMINEEFGIDTKGRDKTQLVNDLTDFLIRIYAQRKRATLIIDEAQNLTAGLLEEMRLLSNLETDKAKLLQIIFVGQPELRMTLSYPELRQLRQRISISCHLQPLTRQETEEYIFHRLEVAGNKDAVIFEEGTMDAIHEFSRGIPRLVNIACDFMMLAAYSEQSKVLTLDLARGVIADLEADNRYWHDEVPKAIPGNGRESLKDILCRLDALDVVLSRRGGALADNKEIIERLLRLEKQMDAALHRTKVDVINSGREVRNDHLNALSHEVGALKLKVANLEKSNYSEPTLNDHKRKGMWRRLFSSSREEV